MNRYKVIKSRATDHANPIKLSKSMQVKCMEESDPNGDWPNWIYCKTDDQEGWVPVQILDVDKAIATVLQAYDATEIDIVVGEIVLAESELNGWIWGWKENETSKGWFPLNHLELIKE